jgi:hypothetical protein
MARAFPLDKLGVYLGMLPCMHLTVDASPPSWCAWQMHVFEFDHSFAFLGHVYIASQVSHVATLPAPLVASTGVLW